MKLIALVMTFVSLSLSSLSAATADAVRMDGNVLVTLSDSPHKRLTFVVELPAPVDAVWTALTTREGLVSWAAPDAVVDMRIGGNWMVSYDPSLRPAGGVILDFQPLQYLTVRARAPDAFPDVRDLGTLVVFYLQRIDERQTRLIVTQTGWLEGGQWDKAYAYLAKGNTRFYNALHQRFVKGPFDWSALMKRRAEKAALDVKSDG